MLVSEGGVLRVPVGICGSGVTSSLSFVPGCAYGRQHVTMSCYFLLYFRPPRIYLLHFCIEFINIQ